MTGRTEMPTGALTRRHLLRTASAAAVALPLGGCGLLGGSEGDDEAKGTGGGKLEKTSLRVGFLPIIDTAPLNLAQKRGYFADEGLKIELVVAQGGARTVPQLVSGDLDVTFTNWPTVFQAQAKGIGEFTIVNPGYEAKEGTFLVMSLPKSGVRKPKDLEGKTVAVNTRNNIAELTTRSAMQVAGVDDSKVTFTELAFPDVPAALQSKQVDASYIVEPFITTVKRDLGGLTILDTASGPTNGIPFAGYVTTKEFGEKMPNTTAAFRRAMDRAQREVADRSKVEEIVPEYADIDEQTTKLMALGTWPTSINQSRLQRVADLMLKFKTLDKKFDVAPLIPKSNT